MMIDHYNNDFHNFFTNLTFLSYHVNLFHIRREISMNTKYIINFYKMIWNQKDMHILNMLI